MWFLILVGIFNLFLMYRNRQVFDYRMELLDKVSKMADKDIAAGREFRWRYEYLGTVEYNTMVMQFWKPLDSFYPNKSFIKP